MDIDKPGSGYGALGGATNIRATAEEREDKQIIVSKLSYIIRYQLRKAMKL